jgi:hypothetical protein
MAAALNADLLLGLTLRLGCVGVLLQSTELIANRRELEDDGLLGWGAAPSSPWPVGPARTFLRGLQRYPGCAIVLATRACLALACLFLPVGAGLTTAALALLLLAQLYYHRRFAALGSDADIMQLIGFGAVFAGGLPGGTPVLQTAALGFLAVHVLIAYVASGFDKATSRRWRSGAQVALTFQYSMYRLRPLGDFLASRPVLARAVTGGVILLELLFPLCLVLPAPGFWIFLAAGLAFHVTIAFTMGLHGFLWSFVAAYPGLYFVHAWVAAQLYSR